MKIKVKKLWTIFSVLIFSIAALLPAADDAPATQEDISALRSDIQQVRDQLQRQYDLNTAASQRSLRISGTIQSRLTVPTEVTLNTYSGFSLPLATLTFRGSLKKDYEDWRHLDYVVSLGGANPGAPVFQDAYLNYNILPANQADIPRLSVQFGQQQKPFGLEAAALEDKKPVINQAQFVAATGFVARDIGLVFKGDLFPSNDFGYGFRIPLVEYSLGVVNGTGFNSQGAGANSKDQFDTLYRVVVNPIAWNITDDAINYNDWLRGFSLGASVYEGTSRLALNTDNHTSGIETGRKNRTGFDVAYVRTPFGFTYETVTALDEVGSTTNANIDAATFPAWEKNSRKGSGDTLTLFWTFGEQFIPGYRNQSRSDDWWPVSYQVFYRADNWNPNTDDKENNIEIRTLGMNIFFAETTKFQLNYNLKSYYAAPDADKNRDKKDSSEIVAQFQYGF